MAIDALPEVCRLYCPVITNADVEAYGLVTTKNCKGPDVSMGVISDKLTVHMDGSVTSIESGETIDHASFVCRNAGINISLVEAEKRT